VVVVRSLEQRPELLDEPGDRLRVDGPLRRDGVGVGVEGRVERLDEPGERRAAVVVEVLDDADEVPERGAGLEGPALRELAREVRRPAGNEPRQRSSFLARRPDAARTV
jgi:hypothetical protein